MPRCQLCPNVSYTRGGRGQELPHLPITYFLWMSFVVKKDVAFDPVYISFFGSQTELSESACMPNLLKKFRFSHIKYLASLFFTKCKYKTVSWTMITIQLYLLQEGTVRKNLEEEYDTQIFLLTMKHDYVYNQSVHKYYGVLSRTV